MKIFPRRQSKKNEKDSLDVVSEINKILNKKVIHEGEYNH